MVDARGIADFVTTLVITLDLRCRRLNFTAVNGHVDPPPPLPTHPDSGKARRDGRRFEIRHALELEPGGSQRFDHRSVLRYADGALGELVE